RVGFEKVGGISGPHISDWISMVGEFETLIALAGYSYEHPHDSFPELLDATAGRMEARRLGHPLMTGNQCAPTAVRLGGDLPLLIVSGSNMSGKSTLLRAVGL